LFVLNLDHLLEGMVDGRSDVGDVLPEVDGRNGTLGDTLRGKLELLKQRLARYSIRSQYIIELAL
jgi:hypothetical protein